uniref:Uncharacterized protein n=1 Tax=Anopheles maculatus TaxID=74869 RepID=A0A182T4B1_9DIPT
MAKAGRDGKSSNWQSLVHQVLANLQIGYLQLCWPCCLGSNRPATRQDRDRNPDPELPTTSRAIFPLNPARRQSRLLRRTLTQQAYPNPYYRTRAKKPLNNDHHNIPCCGCVRVPYTEHLSPSIKARVIRYHTANGFASFNFNPIAWATV